MVTRFREPSNHLHIAEHFYQPSALINLLGMPDDKTIEKVLPGDVSVDC